MPDGFEVDTHEVAAFAYDLGTAGWAATRKVQQATVKALHDIEATARVLSPVDTGALRGSYGTDMDSDSLGGVVGPTVHYARYVEEGTSTMAPQPALYPAFAVHAPAWLSALEQVAGGVA